MLGTVLNTELIVGQSSVTIAARYVIMSQKHACFIMLRGSLVKHTSQGRDDFESPRRSTIWIPKKIAKKNLKPFLDLCVSILAQGPC